MQLVLGLCRVQSCWHLTRTAVCAHHARPQAQLLCLCTGDVDGSSLELAFSKKKVEDRKIWLQAYVPGTYLDMTQPQITYSDFVNQASCRAAQIAGLTACADLDWQGTF